MGPGNGILEELKEPDGKLFSFSSFKGFEDQGTASETGGRATAAGENRAGFYGLGCSPGSLDLLVLALHVADGPFL